MDALLTSIIPDQNFEIIENQIAQILILEFANQGYLNAASPLLTSVSVERIVPINSDTETPMINVSLHRGDYDNQNIKKVDGAYVYNIDIYTSAPTTDDSGPGDQYARKQTNKIAGMVRTILSYPDYWKNLSLPNCGIISTKVLSYAPMNINSGDDALSDAWGRIKFEVRCIETGQLSGGVLLSQNNSHIRLGQSEKGFYYQYTP